MEKLDKKFFVDAAGIRKAKNNTVVPDDQWIVFLAKDDALPATLDFYLGECKRLGADHRQLDAVKGLIARVKAWRATNSGACHTPDVAQCEQMMK